MKLVKVASIAWAVLVAGVLGHTAINHGAHAAEARAKAAHEAANEPKVRKFFHTCLPEALVGDVQEAMEPCLEDSALAQVRAHGDESQQRQFLAQYNGTLASFGSASGPEDESVNVKACFKTPDGYKQAIFVTANNDRNPKISSLALPMALCSPGMLSDIS